jgi:hemerythrin-like domain-containing protein
MPVVIGAKRESDFNDPVGLLSDCHRRIERFLNVLITVTGETQGGPLTDEQKTSFEAALLYFRVAAPKHTADEEESLFPRLRRIATAEMKPVLTRIDALEQDHQRAARNHQEIDRLGQSWLTSGRLPLEEAARLLELLRDLSNLYLRHIAIEDQEVFPAAARLLSRADREAVGAEMASRRRA